MPGTLQGPTTGFVDRMKGKGFAPSSFLNQIGRGGMAAAGGGAVYTSLLAPALGNIVFTANPANNDTITLNATVWTFVTSGASGAQTNLKASLALTLVQLVADLRASADAQVVKFTFSANATTLFLAAVTPGTGGNALTVAASVATPAAGTLLGGVAPLANAADSTEDTILTFTLPPNTLDVVGRGLIIQAWGNVTATSATKTVRMYFGTSIVGSLAYATTATGFWQMTANIWKTATNGQMGYFEYDAVGAATARNASPAVGCEPDNASIVCKITGQSTSSAGNIVQLYGAALYGYN